MASGETSFNSYTFTYKWTINDLEARLYNPSDLKSPVFSSPPGAQPATKWMLTIPSGDRSGSKRSAPIDHQYLVVELQRIVNPRGTLSIISPFKATNDSQIGELTLGQIPTSGMYDNEDIWVEASLKPPTIITRKNSKLFSRGLSGIKYASQGPTKLPKSAVASNNRFSVRCDDGGLNVISFNYFLATSKVRNSESVMFECEIKVWSLDKPIHVTKDASPFSSEFTNQSNFNLSKCMEEARQSHLFTDVTLVADGKEFKAHKVVLASQSHFFKTRFSSRWIAPITVGTTGDRVEMTDVSASVMEAILSYMYTGTVANIEKVAYQLLPAAEEYGLVELQRMCEETLAKSLTSNSAVDIIIDSC